MDTPDETREDAGDAEAEYAAGADAASIAVADAAVVLVLLGYARVLERGKHSIDGVDALTADDVTLFLLADE